MDSPIQFDIGSTGQRRGQRNISQEFTAGRRPIHQAHAVHHSHYSVYVCVCMAVGGHILTPSSQLAA